MANINLNVSPYFDDFDETKDYLRVLFRPGFPVQARELTTLQSFLSEQIERFGNNIFADGSKVTGAEVEVDNEVHVLRLTGSSNINFPLAGSGVPAAAVSGTLDQLEGRIISNLSGTVKAIVVRQPPNTGISLRGDLFIKYLTTNQFVDGGGYIISTTEDNPEEVTIYWNTFESVSPATIGYISGGVFYVQGQFSRIAEQTVAISRISNTPTIELGFRASDVIVTQNEDSSILDNARGSSNEGAPGAHRYTQRLTLVTSPIGTITDPDYYRVLTVINGLVSEKPVINPQYEELGRTLARRTYDESGHYAVRPFSHTVDTGDSERVFNVQVGASKAYVRGYEVNRFSATDLVFDKGLDDVELFRNQRFVFEGPTNVAVSNIVGTLPGFNNTNPYTHANRINLKNSSGDTIGVARPYAIHSRVVNGSVSTRLYLYDIRMFTTVQFDAAGSSFSSSLTTGMPVENANGDTGFVYTEEGTPDAGRIVLLNSQVNFRGQSLTSGVVAGSGTVTFSTTYRINQVTSITGEGGFSCDVDASSLITGSELLITDNRHISSYKEVGASDVLDNSFTAVSSTGDGSGGAIDAANGVWSTQRVDDANEITKVQKFAYMKIKYEDGDRVSTGYGWLANDRHVSLYHTDIHKVYGVNTSSTNDFTNGRFKRITLGGAGANQPVPQGSIITGVDSGTRAIVALSNSTANSLTSITSTHETIENTGVATTLEIVYLRNSSFTANEDLTVETPQNVNEYTLPLTYLSDVPVVDSTISGSYMVDDGQRGEYYDVGALVRKPNSPTPRNDIIVFFTYFEAEESQTSQFLYYSADSYDVDFFDYDVRYYEGNRQEIIPKQLDTGRDLRNSLDFRFRSRKSTNVGSSPFSFATRSFQTQSRLLPNSLFVTDFYEYLGRIDLIELTREGAFSIKRGVPASMNPKRPNESPDNMTLSFVIIPPAVRYPDDEVFVEVQDNRRYTMRDIGRIDSRVKSLESAVALSLLESQALADDVEGRSKLGFVTDDFSVEFDSTASAGDRMHPEFFASVDTDEKSLLPPQTDGIDPEMIIANETRMATGFFDDWLIPTFTEETFIDQSDATDGHRINPFAVWTFQGEVRIRASMDTFRIRRDSFFTRLNGQTNPVSEERLRDFQRLTVNSPGGVRTSVNSWVGRARRETFGGHGAPAQVKARVFELGRQFGGRRSFQEQATTTTRARRTTTTTTFSEPRSIGNEIETLENTEVIQNNQEYEVRSREVTFAASNLRRNTEHYIYFAGQRVGLTNTYTTDEEGNMTGSFFTPSRVRVGDQIVEFRDAETDGGFSNGSAVYKVVGHLDEFSVTQRLTQSVTSSQTRDVVQGVDFSDPVAQIFILPLNEDQAAGDPRRFTSIISSIDLWLAKVDIRSGMNKVTIEIREAVNGYPGGPDRILGTTGEVTVSLGDQIREPMTPNANNAVNFKFLDPVVLNGGTEYAVVVKSPSEVMELYVAELGRPLLNGSGIHDRQPQIGGYAGSFFVSQNSSTWEPSQNVDLSFRLRRCNFTQGQESSFTMQSVHDNQARNGFQFPIGMFNQGLALETFRDSPYVLVRHPFHGLNFTNAQSSIAGTGAGTINGIPVDQVEGEKEVLFPTLSTYFVKSTVPATSTGVVTTSQINTFAGHCHVFSSMILKPMIERGEFDRISATVSTTDTNSINLETAGTKISNRDIKVPTATNAQSVQIGELIEFDNPKIVRNGVNATGVDLEIVYSLTPGTIYSAPFCPRENNLFPIVYRNVTGNFLTVSDIDNLTVRAPISGNDDANQSHASFIAAQNSREEHAAYVTREITLEVPADGLTVHFDADMEPGSSVDLAYKVRPFGDADPFDSIDWVDFPPNQQVNETNYGMFSSVPDVRAFTARVGDLPEFAAFKVRLRLRTENEAQIPRVKDLRIIADL